MEHQKSLAPSNRLRPRHLLRLAHFQHAARRHLHLVERRAVLVVGGAPDGEGGFLGVQELAAIHRKPENGIGSDRSISAMSESVVRGRLGRFRRTG